MEKYSFMGPNERSFDMKKATKVKKLVKYLFDFNFTVVDPNANKIAVSIKPYTGFTSVVAEAILEYKEKHPDKVFNITLFTEYKTDFAELPEKTQQLFDKLVGYDGSTPRKVICMGSKEHSKGVYAMMTSQGIPVYYHDPNAKKDSTFMKELSWIEIKRRRINLFENLSGHPYTGDGIRKRSNAITYSYRIHAGLPNNQRLTEESAGYVTINHAQIARNRCLITAMWQKVEPNDVTVSDVFAEYIETKDNTPSLQIKYRQYFNSFIAHKTGHWKIQHFTDGAIDPSVTQRTFRNLSLYSATDGRYKEDGFYNDENKWEKRYLTDEYKQGFYAFLSNLFDYAYQRGYIPYQPMLLVDTRKQ